MGWLDVLETGLTAAGKYLTERERLRTERSLAKYNQGSGMGLETIMALLTMGSNMGRGTITPQPAPQVQRQWTPGYGMFGYPPVIPGTPPITTVPPGAQLPPTAGGTPMTTPVRYQGATTAPYVQQTAGEMVPFPTQQLGQWLQGATQGGGIVNAPQLYNQTMGGLRAKSFVAVPNPMTGNLSYFRNAGRPILFSGDLRACKRVNKVASRARRASPRRRRTTRRR